MGDDCGQAIEKLYTFLDGELTDQRRVEIRQHLDDCSPCLQAFDFEAELRIMISVRCRDDVPEALRLRVAAALMAAEAARRDQGGG
jgi:mycothiol system anti-sigma-R factor